MLINVMIPSSRLVTAIVITVFTVNTIVQLGGDSSFAAEATARMLYLLLTMLLCSLLLTASQAHRVVIQVMLCVAVCVAGSAVVIFVRALMGSDGLYSQYVIANYLFMAIIGAWLTICLTRQLKYGLEESPTAHLS